MTDYGVNVSEKSCVELSPGYDLWMRGARFGVVRTIRDGIATVKLDHPQVKRLARIPVADLKPV